MVVRRFEVWLCSLDPTEGAELKKNRQCLIISSDEMNRHLQTVIIAPMTSTFRDWPSRIPCQFAGKNGFVVMDQIRTVDKTRLIELWGIIDKDVSKQASDVLIDMFHIWYFFLATNIKYKPTNKKVKEFSLSLSNHNIIATR